jgi:hypothetical protein
MSDSQKQKNISTVFNEKLDAFLKEIQQVFPTDPNIRTAIRALNSIKSMNTTLIIKLWKIHFVDKYKREIEQGNIDFFVNKDFSEDLVGKVDNSEVIMQSINQLRDPIRQMTPNDKRVSIEYIQLLSKLSELYAADNA